MPSPTWVLLRGLARESGHWGPFLPAFRAAQAGATLLTLDLPGAGARLREAVPGSVREIVRVVREEARERLAPGSPVLLFGVSLGGMVVMEWAARHPSEIAGVAVGASSAGGLSPFWKRMRPRGLARLLASTTMRDPVARQTLIVRAVSNRRDLWPSTIEAWAEVERERRVSLASVRRQTSAAARWRAPASIRVPTLFLVGRRDRLVHADCSRALAERFEAELVEHPTAGHDLTTDATEWCVDHLARFGERVARAATGPRG